MSLINEALKKAQRVRTGDPAGSLPPMPGGGPHVNRRGQSRSAQQLLLLAAGGVVLVVLSVVITFWIANRAPPEKTTARSVAGKSTAAPVPTPAIVAPVIIPPSPVTKNPPVKAEPAGPAIATTPPAPPAVAPPLQTATTAILPPAPRSSESVAATIEARPTPAAPVKPAPISESPGALPAFVPAPVSTSAALPKTDERVHVFVDSIHVTGIRSSGGDSRVLMNDRVFRVNDIVERTYGVRLTKVEPDALTFTDANGATYVKNF